MLLSIPTTANIQTASAKLSIAPITCTTDIYTHRALGTPGAPSSNTYALGADSRNIDRPSIIKSTQYFGPTPHRDLSIARVSPSIILLPTRRPDDIARPAYCTRAQRRCACVYVQKRDSPPAISGPGSPMVPEIYNLCVYALPRRVL